MNKDQFENQWGQIRGNLRDKWSNLTEEDIRQINGRYDQLIMKIQQRYGYSRDTAEEEVRAWLDRGPTRIYGQDKTYAHTNRQEDAWKTKKTDNSSVMKWALALGIPLLLLAGYLAHESSKMHDTRAIQDRTFIAESAEDRTLSQNIRQDLQDNGLSATDLENIRIAISNGNVTVSGVAPSEEDRNLILRIVQNNRGVRNINNQLRAR